MFKTSILGYLSLYNPSLDHLVPIFEVFSILTFAAAVAMEVSRHRPLPKDKVYMGVSENVVYPIVPNGFHDHYPVFKWLFHWED